MKLYITEIINLFDQCKHRMVKIGKLINGTADIDVTVVDNSHLLDVNMLVKIFKECVCEMALGLFEKKLQYVFCLLSSSRKRF